MTTGHRPMIAAFGGYFSCCFRPVPESHLQGNDGYDLEYHRHDLRSYLVERGRPAETGTQGSGIHRLYRGKSGTDAARGQGEYLASLNSLTAASGSPAYQPTVQEVFTRWSRSTNPGHRPGERSTGVGPLSGHESVTVRPTAPHRSSTSTCMHRIRRL